MHAILFSIKRTFHKSVWFGRFLLRSYVLTPSRFDILYILREHRDLPSLWQSRIREILGVARPTVSRMIRALEALGFITRTRSALDRRQWEIALTKHGRRIIEHAIKTILKSGIMALSVIHFVCPKWNCPVETLEALERLDNTLRYMRERLLDEATLAYPWHPED